MGERLVLKYNISEANKIYSVSIYQHWSGYTSSAIETAKTIEGWISNFQEDQKFEDDWLIENQFIKFVLALGSGEIIDGAYFTENSVKRLNSLGFNAIKYKSDKINRNNGLIDINELTNSAMDWGEMIAEYDANDWFTNNKTQNVAKYPEHNELDFYDRKVLTIDTPENIDPFSLTIKDLLLQQENDPNPVKLTNIDDLQFLNFEFDPEMVDVSEMPTSYNKTLKDYLSQNTYVPTNFYDNLEDILKIISNPDAPETNHLTFNTLSMNNRKLTTITVYTAIC